MFTRTFELLTNFLCLHTYLLMSPKNNLFVNVIISPHDASNDIIKGVPIIEKNI